MRCRWIEKNGSQAEQAFGRSRGGFSTKLHILTEGLGNALRFILTGGQRHDITQAEASIDSLRFDHVIADTAYDVDWFLALLAELDSVAMIPPRANRTTQRDYDRHLHKERHLVECFINKLKLHISSQPNSTCQRMQVSAGRWECLACVPDVQVPTQHGGQ